MKVKIELVRGKQFYVLQSFSRGRRHRKFFRTKTEAIKARAAAQKQVGQVNRLWASLPDAEQVDIMALVQEMRRRGKPWRELLESQLPSAVAPGPTLKEAIYGMLADERMANCSEKYLHGLEGFLRRFSAGRERMRVGEVTPALLQEFLSRIKNVDSRKTWRTRLSSLLGWCVRRKHLAENPLNQLERIRRGKPGPPTVLDPVQARKAFDIVKGWPSFLPYFILGIMVGLRPEESDQVTLEMVRGDWQAINLPAKISKTRTPRLIPIPEEARAWLRTIEPVTKLALSQSQRRRYVRKLRDTLSFAT